MESNFIRQWIRMEKWVLQLSTFFQRIYLQTYDGMAIRLKFCKSTAPTKDVPVGEKRKRERPREITKALLIE